MHKVLLKNIKIKDAKITDLFFVKRLGEEKQYPLNVKFRYIKNNEIDQKGKGPGVYVISYKDKIIYIGQHLSKQNIYNIDNFDPSKKDAGIVKERCLKHLQTFTSRSHVLKLGKSQARIDWFQRNANIEDGFYSHINFAGQEDNHFKDAAPLTSKNRIRFSKKHWEDFSFDGEENVTNILNGFEIWWFKVGPFEDLASLTEYEHAEGIVKHIETQLICRYLPECNSEFYKVIQSYESLCQTATHESLTKEINELINEVSPNEGKSVVTDDSFIICPN